MLHALLQILSRAPGSIPTDSGTHSNPVSLSSHCASLIVHGEPPDSPEGGRSPLVVLNLWVTTLLGVGVSTPFTGATQSSWPQTGSIRSACLPMTNKEDWRGTLLKATLARAPARSHAALGNALTQLVHSSLALYICKAS